MKDRLKKAITDLVATLYVNDIEPKDAHVLIDEMLEKFFADSSRYFRVTFAWVRKPSPIALAGNENKEERGNSDVIMTTKDGLYLNHTVLVASLMKNYNLGSVIITGVHELSKEDAEEWMRKPVLKKEGGQRNDTSN